MRSLKLALAALAATVALGTAQAEPVKIRTAWVAPVSNWASIVLEKKDLAKHLGKSYTLEAVRFAGTPPMITALANGELKSPTSPTRRFRWRCRTPTSTTCGSSPTSSRTASAATIATSSRC